jgi:integrase
MALTVKRVRDALTAGVKGSRHFDDAGMALIVSGKGTGYWQRRFTLHGKTREMSLGPVRRVGETSLIGLDLEQARAANKAVSSQLLQKIDPLDARRADHAAKAAEAAQRMAAPTFQDMAASYIESNLAGWKWPSYAKNWRQSLEQYVFPLIGALPVGDIAKPHVLAVLEQKIEVNVDGEVKSVRFWEAYPTAANRVRSRIELILNFAKARDQHKGDNPATFKVLKHVLPARDRLAKTEPYAALPFADVPAFYVELGKREGTAARALQFLILTAARSNEVLGAKWSEIDLDNKTWTVPAGRMKAGEEHQVPLSEPAVALLKSLPTESDNPFVFLGLSKDGLSPGSLRSLLLRMRFTHTAHGFRSGFRDWAGESDFPRDVAEAALSHVLGKDATERAYYRTKLFNKRRLLMDAWAQFVTVASVKKVGKVLPMRGRS